eukprot:gene7747-626_t
MCVGRIVAYTVRVRVGVGAGGRSFLERFPRTQTPTNMKLLTHNLLRSRVKGVLKGYPLGINATSIETKDVEFNADFIARMLDRIEWIVLVNAATSLGVDPAIIPQEIPSDAAQNEEFLRALHHILLEIEVIEGHLECPESGRHFPIKKGIPNMLLNEDEV